MRKILVYILLLIIGFIFGCNYRPYEIVKSNKVQCDILLNKYTGQTWFNSAGYWERITKDFVK
jgi:hypothetical protein